MAIDLQILGSKLTKYRDQLQLSMDELADATGISAQRLSAFEQGELAPDGDEILILADFYKCDYKFFVSNERLAPFEQTENLYRRYGAEFRKEDRRRVQDFLFLCDCEQFLIEALERAQASILRIAKKGAYYKGHAEDAAVEVRRFLGYRSTTVPADVFADIRKLGCHVFRRRLSNSNISGLCVRHPTAGACVLVNYSEDIYRQRFSAAHEAAHALLDDDEVIVSLTWQGKDTREIRANTFASRFLLPPEFLKQITEPQVWNASKTLDWSNKLKVNPEALSIALKEAGLITGPTQQMMKRLKIPARQKSDPELPASLSPRSRERKQLLLEQGLSTYYVGLCFDAYERHLVSANRLSEMLLVEDTDLAELAPLFGRSIEYAR